jgi:hypothetical protein
MGIWSMCVTETEKFFPCGTIEAFALSGSRTDYQARTAAALKRPPSIAPAKICMCTVFHILFPTQKMNNEKL